MNKELEALLLSAAKATERGVVGVDEKRARAFGVPVGKFVQKGQVLPGHSRKARVPGYHCPYSVWRPKSGECLMLDDNSFPGSPAARYSLVVLREDSTAHFTFAGRNGRLTLSEMKAYLRGVADGAQVNE